MTPMAPSRDRPRLTTLSGLAKAGREPSLPVRLSVNVGELELMRSYRVLPGRRLTALARFQGDTVIAKVFFADPRALAEGRHEARQLARMAERGLPVPALLADTGEQSSGRILLLQHLPGEDLRTLYRRARENGGADRIVRRAVRFLAELHAGGCLQKDVHLGNFLAGDSDFFVLDAGSIQLPAALSDGARWRNLAELLAQFYPLDVPDLSLLVRDYGPGAPSTDVLEKALERARARRHRHALKKISRDCTDFIEIHRGRLHGMARRCEGDAFTALLAAGIDDVMAAGDFLKQGNSSTVSRVRWQGRDWVIKRYNTKGRGHFLKKQFKPSRAFRSWRNAWWLDMIGLATPRPVGYVEQRRAGLINTAYFVTEHAPGTPVSDLPAAHRSRALRAMDAVFTLMTLLRFNHGDMKASNFLWRDGRLWVLDLDAMRLNLSKATANRLIARDRARWRRNEAFVAVDTPEPGAPR